MEIRDLVSQLISKNTADHFAEEPEGSEASGRLFPVPRLHPPADEAQVAELGIRAGQRLEPGYREFLLLADGMEGFQLSMPLFGCHDWAEGGRAAEGVALGEELLEDGIPEDVGLPEGIGLFPLSVDADRTTGIFMIDAPETLPERIWWVGEGSSSFFGSFADLLGFALDPRSYDPRETVD